MTITRTPEEINDLRYRKALKRMSRFLQKWIYWRIAACTILTLIGFDSSNWQYTYTDADGYMRALRIYHWILNPSFWEQPLTESNYPFGEIIHWTRSMDILWLINMLPFLAFGITDLKELIFLRKHPRAHKKHCSLELIKYLSNQDRHQKSPLQMFVRSTVLHLKLLHYPV